MSGIYCYETYRVKSPVETWNTIKDLVNDVGIIKIERIDNLDRLNMPVYSVYRRLKNNNITIHFGKGATDIQSKVSGVMECIERYFLDDNNAIITEVDNPTNPVDVLDLVPSYYWNGNLIGIKWVEGENILNNDIVHVPKESVCFPYEGGKLFRSNTNGISAGNTLKEAIFHGSLEVIERDSWSLCELSNNLYKKINVENTNNEIIHNLMNIFSKNGINVVLKDLTTDVGIPTVAAITDDDILRDPTLLCIGVGCHLNPEIAIIRALTEVIQSRASQLQNLKNKKRTDLLRRIPYERMKRIHKKWFEYKTEVDISDIPNLASSNLNKDIETVKSMLVNCGFDKLIVVNLNKGLDKFPPVVRVIIPKMEVYCMDRDRISKNAKRRIENLKR